MTEISNIRISEFLCNFRNWFIRITQELRCTFHFQFLYILAETHTRTFLYDTLDLTILQCLSRKEDMAALFKREIASHNKGTLKQRLKAAVYGQLDQEEDNGENLSAKKRI